MLVINVVMSCLPERSCNYKLPKEKYFAVPGPLVLPAVAVCGWCKLTSNLHPHTCFHIFNHLTTWPQMTFDLGVWPLHEHMKVPILYHKTKFDTILDGLRVIPENIGWAACMKNIGRREAESDIFHTCSKSNIFRSHPKEAIQYLHYYVSESDLNKCMKSKHFK